VFAYSGNYLIDLEVGIIMDTQATAPLKDHEVEASREMIDRVATVFGETPGRLAADTAYGSGPNLSCTSPSGTRPHAQTAPSAPESSSGTRRATVTTAHRARS
jgi:hypothetical protein